MKGNRIMIAAPKSGSGKTTVTCALLWALKDQGRHVVSYKCGPDYIDPMFHEKVIGVPARNLDTFFTGEEQTRHLFLRMMKKDSIAVLEGVMGLFDGLGGTREEGSSYHLAKVTGTPIVLVVDAKGMAQSIIPMIAGFLAYDREHLIQGVILNRVSKGCYEILKPLIEEELKTQVLGFLPDDKEFYIGSRHLGLFLPDEMKDIQEKLRRISEAFQQTISVEGMLRLAETAEETEDIIKTEHADLVNADCAKQPRAAHTAAACEKELAHVGRNSITSPDKPVIAVARDEAFCFYYADNIRLLQENGAEIIYFSPLHDEQLPARCHALLLGGGYPELYAEKLSQNSAMRVAVRQAAKSKMPVVAECGGFMYLHSAIIDKEGICHDMAGVIPAVCHDTGKLVRFGYIELREKQSNFLPDGEKIKGHEFHYYDSSDNGNDAVAEKPVTGKEYSCIIENGYCWMGFPHLYYPSNPAFAAQFVRKARKYKETQHGSFVSFF